MKTLKLLGAALAAVTMTFTAQAAKTAKAVVADGGKTLKFVYDETNYGTKDTDWFSVAEAEAQEPGYNPPWWNLRNAVTKVLFDGSFAGYRPGHCAWFMTFAKLATVEGLENLDVSEATSLTMMFCQCESLTSLDLSGFNTVKVTGMDLMFYGCKNLKTILVSDAFTTAAVTASGLMFYNCTALKGGNGTVFDSSKVDKTYARIDKSGAPGYFTRSPTAKVAKVVAGDVTMTTLWFVYDSEDYGEKDTDWFSVAEAEAGHVPWRKSCVINVRFADSFKDYRPKQCLRWFDGCRGLVEVYNIGNLNTANVTNMANMFGSCSMLKSLDVTGFDTSKVTNMKGMFEDCESLTTLDMSGFDTAKVTNMNDMFYGCSSLTTITTSDSFVTTSVVSSYSMFYGCNALKGGAGTAYDSTKTDATYARIDGGPSAPGYFTELRTAKAVVEDGGKTLRFVYDSKDYGTKDTDWFSVAEAEKIDPYEEKCVADVPWYGKRSTVTKVVFDPSFAAYRPKQCTSWFIHFDVLVAVDGLTNLDTSFATNMAYMFDGCSSLTTLDVSGFDTANVTGMAYMFSFCSSLTTLDVTGFDTANVEEMDYMFYGCSSLEAICASDRFVTDRVWFSSGMFHSCSKLVGGAGTAYDSTKTDATYARIDGGPSAPGYFTAATVLPEGSYGIRFAANGGTGAMDGMVCTRDKVYNLTKCAFTAPTGKAFAGWRSSKNGKLYADGVLVFDLAEPGKTVTMTAVWKE